MAVSEVRRFELHQRLQSLLGEDMAGSMMEQLPPVDWKELALKGDIDRRFDEVERRFNGIDRRLDGLDNRLKLMLTVGLTISLATLALIGQILISISRL